MITIIQTMGTSARFVTKKYASSVLAIIVTIATTITIGYACHVVKSNLLQAVYVQFINLCAVPNALPLSNVSIVSNTVQLISVQNALAKQIKNILTNATCIDARSVCQIRAFSKFHWHWHAFSDRLLCTHHKFVKLFANEHFAAHLLE